MSYQRGIAIALLCALLSGGLAWGQPQQSHLRYPDPWFGTWRLGDTTLRMEPREDGFTLHFSAPPSAPGGDYTRSSVFARFDGKEYPSGGTAADVLVFNRIDARTITILHRKNGRDTTTSTVTFPADGKTRISRSTGTDLQGNAVDSTSVWTRVE